MITEVNTLQDPIYQKWAVLFFSFILSCLTLLFAWNKKFFRTIHLYPFPIIQGKDVLRGFGYFIFAEMLLIPSLIGIYIALTETDPENWFNFTSESKAWINLLIIAGGFGGILLAYLSLTKEQQQQILNQTDLTWWDHFKVGITGWFVSYPFVLFVSQGISLILWYLFHHTIVEQVAIQNIRSSSADPFLFILMSLSIVILVPLTEEVLFRGLLQSWLKRRFNSVTPAILLSSFIFALFHFSGEHGLTNIELLPPLFLLSCMIGYLYERQHSLWAPIGLHSFFNAMSLLLLSLQTNP